MATIISLETPAKAALFEKYQINFDVAGIPLGLNKFDPDHIDIFAVFIGPDGKHIRINAYWGIDFCRNIHTPDPTNYSYYDISKGYCGSNGTGVSEAALAVIPDPNYLTKVNTSTPWHIRFAPPLTGNWYYHLVALVEGVSSSVTTGSFQVLNSNNKGYITAQSRNFYFSRNSELFYPIGINAVWAGTVVYNRSNFLHVSKVINDTADNNGNYSRVFISPEFFGIEWKEDGLNDYTSRQDRAWDLDDLLNLARGKNIYLQLCLEMAHHYGLPGTPNFNWDNNPYSRRGGAKVPERDFLENAASRRMYQKKLRYIIARWGYSTNVFAFEFFNEVNQYGGEVNSILNFKLSGLTYPVAFSIINNWLDTMRGYCKNILGDKHLYTTSVATPDETHWIAASSDFATDHKYTSSRNQDHQINYFANLAKQKSQTSSKPYIIGEIGMNSGCYPLSNIPDSIYNLYIFHDALWASVMSGCSGAATYWDKDIVGRCWGGQLAYLPPLVKFLHGENLSLQQFVAITNKCTNDLPSGGLDNDCTDKNVAKPIVFTLYETISTNNDANVEVFVLQYYSGDKMLGWVKNKNNWWFQLPHNDEKTSGNCYNPGSPTVLPLSGIEITIPGLKCDAEYQIDFYSTYPKRKINGPVAEDGGKINAYTIRVFSRCGVLKFKVPDMKVLQPGNAPSAPDYAFKITRQSSPWGHGLIGPQPNAQPFAVTGDGTQIAYRGSDGKLNCFYRSAGAYTWGNAFIGPAGHRGVKPNGAICRGSSSGQIYYHGADDRLQCIYWLAGSWLHAYLTPWGTNAQNVTGDIVSNAAGGRIYYRGIGGKLHNCYWDSGSWRSRIIWLPDAYLIAPNSNIAVSANGNLVTFKGMDGKLHMVYTDTAYTHWHHDYSPGDAIAGFIRMNNAGNVVFYRDSAGRLHQYYYLGSSWHSRIILVSGSPVYIDGPFDIAPDCTYDNAQVYFRGSDGHIMVVYANGGAWIWDRLICVNMLTGSEKCRAGGFMRYANGMLAYDGISSRMEAYYYGLCGNYNVYRM